ncbi:MAG: NAD(P)H-dependent oxidoreductase [Deferribacteraceae bacterium]|jgi:putative NADPH-quinone reductase|nr:NAD(P)H-dependent oxidoreductase [Deferribacteraceae bacterium]
MKTIIFGHPNRESFNGAVLNALTAALSKRGEKYHLIDLYADKFNPVMTFNDLSVYTKGESADPLVKKYIEMLRGSTSLAFIFPVWWSDAPAIVKGFLDKALLPEFAFISSDKGLIGRLSFIERADILTTASSPKWFLRLKCGNPFKKIFLDTILKSIGIKKGSWQHCNIDKQNGVKHREKYLEKIERFFTDMR